MNATYLRFELLRTLRNRRFLFLSLGLMALLTIRAPSGATRSASS